MRPTFFIHFLPPPPPPAELLFEYKQRAQTHFLSHFATNVQFAFGTRDYAAARARDLSTALFCSRPAQSPSSIHRPDDDDGCRTTDYGYDKNGWAGGERKKTLVPTRL